MKGSPTLVAVVLSPETAAALRGLAVHPNVFCQHVTMAYRPTPDVYAKYASFIGHELEFDIVALALDANGQAVVVDGVPSEKEVPHITISCADGIKSSYSNTLFTNYERKEIPTRLRGRGVVQVVPL